MRLLRNAPFSAVTLARLLRVRALPFARTRGVRVPMRAAALWLSLASLPTLAAPAPWYYWRSTVDGARVCAQASPGDGWTLDSAAYDGPGCQPRRKVLVIPMR